LNKRSDKYIKYSTEKSIEKRLVAWTLKPLTACFLPTIQALMYFKH